MKKIIYALVLLIGLIICLSGCSSPSDKGILNGYISKDEHFDKDGFQDYTDYCKYYYDASSDLFLENDIYSTVKEDDIENIRSYFTNFASWMDTADRAEEYDFDDSCISEGDYIYIKTKEGEAIGSSNYKKFDNYYVYFYDTQSATLFYIHSNI
ncbi:hypothetical protein [Clostridium gasigenes]|uniref:Uncharacterized protein n=1 Tax=Clostridium gasigenes TaxID=94869 RepID=A0A7X0VSB0_9CLOT|nr:hypothetical protein [Clostridium gasigenes]MBB6715530.1 hypothetical protein [Clostridium gasigenes]